ncbi:hypothetical protein HY972_02835 [Candidatus Kaiserbacteria bacterium]|nr:hypothetical protein [Candidatus Kaiserbacteria bacterium]
MNTRLISKASVATALSLVLGLLMLTGGGAEVAYALGLTSMSDALSTIKASTLANHEIKFVTPAGGGVAAGETITYNFSSGFVMGSQVLADWDFASGDSNNCSTANFTEKTLAATPSGTTWGAAVSGQVITITSGTDTVAADRCIRLRVGSNASTGGGGTIRITNPTASSPTVAFYGTFGDTGTTTVNIIGDDQVAVTATVDQSLTFSISDNTVGFGSLSASAACFAQGTAACSASEVEAHNIIVGTNAGSGYSLTVNGTTLTNGAFTIATTSANTASTVGSEQFGLRMTATGGVGAVVAPYAAAGYAFDSLNFPDQVAASSAASANTTYSVRYIANIASNTEAGAYTSTLTYVATANF